MTKYILGVLVLISHLAFASDINRHSVVYHEETPDVFYCPQEKHVSLQGKKILYKIQFKKRRSIQNISSVTYHYL